MSAAYWLIEKQINGQAHWWVRADGQFGYWDEPERWTTDASQARHYESKWEAEYVIGTQMTGCVATEHIDVDGPPAMTKGAA